MMMSVRMQIDWDFGYPIHVSKNTTIKSTTLLKSNQTHTFRPRCHRNSSHRLRIPPPPSHRQLLDEGAWASDRADADELAPIEAATSQTIGQRFRRLSRRPFAVGSG